MKVFVVTLFDSQHEPGEVHPIAFRTHVEAVRFGVNWVRAQTSKRAEYGVDEVEIDSQWGR